MDQVTRKMEVLENLVIMVQLLTNLVKELLVPHNKRQINNRHHHKQNPINKEQIRPLLLI
jgi:hypothetical protein